MSHDDDRELDPAERDALEAWTVPDAPAGFADRVMDAMASKASAQPAERAARNHHWRWLAVAAAAVGALTLWQLRGGRDPGGSTGSAAPAERQSIALGKRGVAVAEAGSSLSWTVDGGGAAIAQSAGDVFYRVERGGPFRVETPHGTVRVTGTCFRVEMDMRRSWRDVAAAGIGAALVVTVYEGSVLFAGKNRGGEKKVAAGETLVAGPDGARVVAGDAPSAAALAAEMPSAPEASASREELLARDAQQRTEIASLRAKVRELAGFAGGGRVPGGPGARTPSGRPWFDPSKEDLIRFAAECRVSYDLPPVMGTEPMRIGQRMAGELGLSGEEAAAVNRVNASIHAYYVAELRTLYLEVVGDAGRSDDLSPDAMWSELRDKSPPGEEERANQRIAQERAGLAQPPADLSQLSAIERGMRLQASLGERTERELGAAIGPERARALREKNDGWGMHREFAGCPGKGGEEDQVVR